MVELTSILDLELIEPDRPFIRIGDQKIELNLPTDLGLVDRAQIRKQYRILQELQTRIGEKIASNDEDVEPADAQLITDSLTLLLKIILRNVSDDLLSRLNEGQKMQIVQVFPSAVGWETTETQKAPAILPQLSDTGETSSPTSNSPTEETNLDGSPSPDGV